MEKSIADTSPVRQVMNAAQLGHRDIAAVHLYDSVRRSNDPEWHGLSDEQRAAVRARVDEARIEIGAVVGGPHGRC